MKNMLASFTKHRHIIHAGYTFAGKGSWILQVEISETVAVSEHNSLQRILAQDGTYSFADFTTAFEEYDVQRVIRSYENSISISVHCCQEGEWKQVIFLPKDSHALPVMLYAGHKIPLSCPKPPPFRADNV